MDFHRAIIDATGSERISRAYAGVQSEILLCMAQLRPHYDRPAEVAAEHRELLFGIVYGMLGTVADTEDVLQDTWLSWEARSHGAPIEHPRSYLVRVAINAAIARQAAVRRRRETYVGPWLPEPVDDLSRLGADADLEVAESVSLAMLAMLVVLESLGPIGDARARLDAVVALLVGGDAADSGGRLGAFAAAAPIMTGSFTSGLHNCLRGTAVSQGQQATTNHRRPRKQC